MKIVIIIVFYNISSIFYIYIITLILLFYIPIGQDKAMEILELLNEILLLLQLPLQELCSHVVGRISEYPSAGLVSILLVLV